MIINIKNRIKKMFFSIHEYSFQSLANKIEKYDVVSFDVFDTLIKRTVYDSKCVYELAAHKYNQITDDKIDEIKFKKDRVNAAYLAVNLKKGGTCEEITLKEIYNQLPIEYEKIKNELMCLEMKEEYDCCKENPMLKKIYSWCIEKNKHVIITSDMYLPLEVMDRILRKNGYSKYEKIYLSSELKKKKSSGSIFEQIIQDYKDQKIIHIGDSIKADYLMPRKWQIDSILITPHPNRTNSSVIRTPMTSQEKETFKHIKDVMSSHINPDWDDYYKYGFEVIGPLLFGFSVWLDNELNKNDFEHVFFMSRDGYMLMKAYQLINEERKCQYFYVSRRSLAVPLLFIENGLCGLIKTNDLRKKWNCKMLSYRLGLDYNYALKNWLDYGLKEDESIRGSNMIDDIRILNFYNSVKEKVISNSICEYQNLMNYLKKIKFKGKIAVIDTGGNCTIQRSLNVLVNNTEISGFYLWKKNTQNMLVKSFPVSEEEMQFGNMTIVEFFLTAHEGSTLSYKATEDGICEVTHKYEHDEITDNIICSVQKGALKFIDIFKESDLKYCFSENISKNNIVAFSKYPTFSQANLLSKLNVFNDDNYEKMNEPDSLFRYLAKPSMLKKDFSTACWKIGFLKKLFKVPINYFTFLKMVKGLIEK